MFRQLASDGSSLLDSQVQGSSLALVVFSDGLTLRLVDDGQDTSDILSDIMNLGDLTGSTSSNLLHSEGRQLLLEFLQLLHQLCLVLRAEGVCCNLLISQ